MPFDKGSISYCSYIVEGGFPENAIELLEARKAGPLSKVKDVTEIGICGRHLLETRIEPETVMVGDIYHFHVREANRTIPPSILKAECLQRELAQMAADNTSTVSRKKKKEIREEVEELLLKDSDPNIKGVEVVFDPVSNRLFICTPTPSKADTIVSFLIDCLSIEPLPETLEVGARLFSNISSIEQLTPISFVEGSDESVSTIGRDFLTWLWSLSEGDGAGNAIVVPDVGEFLLNVNEPLVLTGQGTGASESVVRKGLALTSREAQGALIGGKKLRACKLTFARGDEFWHLAFDADNYKISGVKLPDGEALERVSKIEERLHFLNTLNDVLAALIKLFMEKFHSESDESRDAILNWARERYWDGKGTDS